MLYYVIHFSVRAEMNPNEFITRYQSLIATCEYTCSDEAHIDRLIQGTRFIKARQRIIYMEMPKGKKVSDMLNAEYIVESTSPSLPCLDAIKQRPHPIIPPCRN